MADDECIAIIVDTPNGILLVEDAIYEGLYSLPWVYRSGDSPLYNAFKFSTKKGTDSKLAFFLLYNSTLLKTKLTEDNILLTAADSSVKHLFSTEMISAEDESLKFYVCIIKAKGDIRGYDKSKRTAPYQGFPKGRDKDFDLHDCCSDVSGIYFHSIDHLDELKDKKFYRVMIHKILKEYKDHYRERNDINSLHTKDVKFESEPVREEKKDEKKDKKDEKTSEKKDDKKDEKKNESEEGGGSLCFIATAAYGTPLAPEIDVLRNYRDFVLNASAFGRSFVRFYYRTSPPIARFISRHESLKRIVRFLLRPIINALK